MIIVTGPRNSGKTTFLYALCARLERAGYSIGGIGQVPPLSKSAKTTLTLSDLMDGEVRVLMDTQARVGWARRGRFYIDYGAFEWANWRLMEHAKRADYLVIDEIGPIELTKGGFYPALEVIFNSYQGTVIAVVRDKLLDSFIKFYRLKTPLLTILRVREEWEKELSKVVMV
ncbi:MAG: nucleoside-triphosphatase [Sphaerochaetaceae bacterium]